MRNTQRKPNRYIAAKLPQNILGEHIERRVNNYIKQYDTNGEAGQVHIRVVYSGDKTVEVRPGMKARYGIETPAILLNSCIPTQHLPMLISPHLLIYLIYQTGLLTPKKCLRAFPIVPKHSLHSKRLTV